jgi:hypothetical protein
MRRCYPLLDAHLQDLADATSYRILMLPQRFAREGQHYADNANILLLSWLTGKEAFLKCGLLSHTCKRWKLCPYCCRIKRMEVLGKFLPVFQTYEGRWGFFNLSFTRPHCYEDVLEFFWDALRFGFEMMIEQGEFDAVFLLEEFAVLSYWPVPKVMAHVHAVVLADEITIQKTDRLKTFVNNYPGWVKVPQIWVTQKKLRTRLGDRLVDRKRRWLQLYDCDGIPLALSSRTYQIETEMDFAGILAYLVKPIDWSEIYRKEWDRYCAEDREVRVWFNQNVDQVVHCFQFWSWNRPQHSYLGKAHHARKDFIGIPKKKRETAHQEGLLRARLEECNDERLFTVADADFGRPLELEPDGGWATSQDRDGATADVQAGALENVNKLVAAVGPGGEGLE